jgi:two-component system sensor kinase FixL
MVSDRSIFRQWVDAVRASPDERQMPAAMLIAGYLLAHVLMDAGSFVQPVLKLGITPWSPQAGLVVAFLYAYTRGFWWSVVAFILAELLIRGIPIQWWLVPIQAVCVAGVYQAAAAALRHFRIFELPPTLRTTLQFSAIAALAALAAGIVVVGSYVATAALPAERFSEAVGRYWVGDLNGILMLTPLMLNLHAIPKLLRAVGDSPLAFAGVGLGSVAALMLVFLIGNPEDLRFFYVLFVPALASALIWGTPGLLLTAIGLQIGLMFGVQRLPEVAPLVDLQYLMSTLVLSGLALGAVVSERSEAAKLALQREMQISEREARLARASRAATAGELASALAHELNQPMTALVGYLRASEIMIAGINASDPRLAPALHKAADEALRAADILGRLRNFYAGRDPQLETMDIGIVLRSTAESSRWSDRRENVSIAFDIPADLPAAVADRVFIEVIFANLVSNALDATSDRTDARIVVSARVKNSMIEVIVDDNGPGVSPAMRAELFKTFVTSKPDGMGVGLAVSRSLAQACGCELTACDSRLGGAGFRLDIPVKK